MKQVTAAVILFQGRVLLARRGPGGPAGGKWEFPGGTVEAGETPEQCLRRELGEELGITARVGEFVGSSRTGSRSDGLELRAYLVTSFRGRIDPSAHEEVRWVEPSELAAFDLPEADLRILPKVRRALGTLERSL